MVCQGLALASILKRSKPYLRLSLFSGNNPDIMVTKDAILSVVTCSFHDLCCSMDEVISRGVSVCSTSVEAGAYMADILVVEDEQLIARLLKETLQSEGYNVVTVLNGEDAVQFALCETPHLIILDLNVAWD